MIPFNQPEIHGKELDYIKDAVNRQHLSGDGYYTKLCNNLIMDFTGSIGALLTHSCTAALEMSAILLGLGPGDEVIMPSFTFVSTANAVVLRGATPVFVDIDPMTLNIDPKEIEKAITPKTKSIFIVHYAGVICDMKSILAISKAHNIPIVEDAAQALLSTYNGQLAGSFGDMACFSFHETKNVISGEGGALTINDNGLIQRAEIIREKGTNRRQFYQGLVDKYTWVDLGSSFLPSELTAAFLLAQLEAAKELTQHRLESWSIYNEALAKYETKELLQRPTPLPSGQTHNGHMYYVLMPNKDKRNQMIARMKDLNVVTPFHYVPLHLAPAGQKYTRAVGNLKNTIDVSDRLIRLPMYAGVKCQISAILQAFDVAINELL